jgi:hypothetical protein
VIISQGVRLVGSGYGIQGLGGRVFHGRTTIMPRVNGGFLAQDITGRVSIAGFEIYGGLVSPGTVGLMAGPITGNGIVFSNVAEGAILGNVIHDVGWYGILVATDADNQSFVEVKGNHVSRAPVGIRLEASDDSHLGAVVQGNTLKDFVTSVLYSAGIEMVTRDDSSGDFDVIGNAVFNADAFGLVSEAQDTSEIHARFIGNLVVNNRFGLAVSSYGAGAVGTYLLENNLVLANLEHGIEIHGLVGGVTTATLSGNIVGLTGGSHIYSRPIGGTINYISTGTQSNTVFDTPGNPAVAPFEATIGTQTGSLLINDVLIIFP